MNILKSGTLATVRKPLILQCEGGVTKMKLLPGDDLEYVGFRNGVRVFDFQGAKLVTPSWYLPQEISIPLAED